MNRYAATLLLLSACSADDPEPPSPSCESARYFAIDHLAIPRDVDGVVTGLDLDRDAEPDNQGGVLLDSVFSIYAEEGAEAAWTAQLADRLAGDLAWLVELPSCGGASTELRSGVRDGEVVHLGDRGVAPLGALADFLGGADPAWHEGVDFTARLALSGDEVRGTLGFGFAPPYRQAIGESFLGWLNARLAAGQSTYGELLDANDDGTITYDELDLDAVFDLLMRPDLDALGDDGVDDSYSFGVDVHAVEVRVE